MRNQRAIVTLVIGDAYQRLWRRHCRPGWEHYAARHGLDLIVLDASLDASPRAVDRSPSWQKLLILSQPFARRYEQVLWLDADIVVHPQAPSVFDGVPIEYVGAVDELSNPTPAIHDEAILKWHHLAEARGETFQYDATPLEVYRAFGFADGFDRVAGGGVLVLAPEHHREMLEHVYRSYEEMTGTHMNLEMRPLSYTLLEAGRVHWLDVRFNLLWPIYKIIRFPLLLANPRHPSAPRCAAEALAESHFLHFAGGFHEVTLLQDQAPLPRIRRPWTASRQQSNSMLPPPCTTPIALLAFNRPSTTARVFDAIRAVRPRQLFLIADGPRADHPDDAQRCAAVRALLEAVDWDCEVRATYAPQNLGLKARVDSGLDWLFDQVEAAIILEDDCLPEPSFFRFCEELLVRYRDEPQVMTISGSDFKFGLLPGEASYSFSRYPLIWGWATWRRAWHSYDPTMSEWRQALESGWLRTILDDPHTVQYWEFVLQQNAETLGTWDYAWLFSAWRRGGLSIHPAVNLVSNIGFGADASHTRAEHDIFANLPTESLAFPLHHPPAIERDEAADRLIEKGLFSGTLDNLWQRLRARRRAHRHLG